MPRDPIAAVRFGLRSLEQGTGAWNLRFLGDVAPALFTGVVAHAAGGMPSLASAGAGLLLAMHAHGVGWGFPKGGSQVIADALANELRRLGGEIVTDAPVRSLDDVRGSRAVLLDTSPELLLTADLPWGYRRAIRRYRYGSGVAKVDFALDGPVPWTNPEVGLAPTVHLGGSREEIAAAENAVRRGLQPGVDDAAPRHPYVLATQPTVADPSRAPAGKHVLWAYTHVPAGSTLDATELVTREVERFAPGFRDLVLASAQRTRHRPRRPQRELRRRRHLRGRAHPHAVREAPGGVDGAVAHAAAGRLPLLERDAPRPGRARHERVVGGQARAAGAVRHRVTPPIERPARAVSRPHRGSRYALRATRPTAAGVA